MLSVAARVGCDCRSGEAAGSASAGSRDALARARASPIRGGASLGSAREPAAESDRTGFFCGVGRGGTAAASASATRVARESRSGEFELDCVCGEFSQLRPRLGPPPHSAEAQSHHTPEDKDRGVVKDSTKPISEPAHER